MTLRAVRTRGAGLRAVLLLAVAFGACGEDTARYGPASDDAAMTAIASAWAQSAGLSLSLCEDLTQSAAWPGPDGCQVDHVVRGGGLGLAHSEKRGGGCAGGCPHRVIAYVVGTASGGGLAAPAAVSGVVYLQSYPADDPYAFPYTLDLTCSDPGSPCTITGTLGADGRLAAELAVGPAGSPRSQHALDRAGAASCP